MSLNIFTRNVQLFGVTVIKFLKALIQISLWNYTQSVRVLIIMQDFLLGTENI